MDNKNFVIAVLVAMLCLMGYQQFVQAPKQQAALAAKQAEEAAAAQAAPEQQSLIQTTAAKPTTKPEEFFAFSTPEADIMFSSKGAGIKEYSFKDIVGNVNLTPYPGEGFYGTFSDLDFSLSSQNASTIVFTSKIDKLTITKTYVFNENGINNLTLSFANKGKEAVTLSPFAYAFGPGLGTVPSEMKDNPREMKALYAHDEGKKRLTVNAKLKNDNLPQNGGWVWAGVQNRYFLAVIMPKNWQSASLSAGRKAVGTTPRLWGLLGKSNVEGPWLSANVTNLTVNAGETLTQESDFYFGPKDYEALETLPYNLEKSIHFGFFGDLGKLARGILDTLYKYTGNYGVAIIIFAVILQVLLLKLTLMQHKSSLVMKKIQPEMKKIQDNYKDDKEAMQRAMLDLYKKYKFNPASGCLPLLLQLPIFLALFNALRTSWDLHGAPFVFWITDLSSKDPYYVLPVIMGAIMYFQQRLSAPMGGDPMQTAMLRWMPVIFTFVFINFPAGLVLYWLTNSIISFGVQFYLNRKDKRAAV